MAKSLLSKTFFLKLGRRGYFHSILQQDVLGVDWRYQELIRYIRATGQTSCLRRLKGVWESTLSVGSSVLDGLTTVPPQLQLLGELFWHFLGQEQAWVNDSFHSRRDLALMEFTCLAFQIQSHKWNARHRKAEREKSKGAKQWRMTRMAKLFGLYPALRHQRFLRINEEKRKIVPQLTGL